MIKIQKQSQNNQASIIRPASEQEMSNYEKDKLAGIEEQAQRNRLEVIRVNGNRIPIDTGTKTANIKVGDLAFKSVVTSNELDNNELFFIRCSLD
jgi:hypothetical protein